jgi:hypothetical protein
MTDNSTFPFTVTEHVVDAQHIREYPNATRRRDASLKLILKQYTPIDNPSPQAGDLTIIGAHGCGFPKVFSFLHPYHRFRNGTDLPLFRNYMSRSGRTYILGVKSMAIESDQSGSQMLLVSAQAVSAMKIL